MDTCPVGGLSLRVIGLKFHYVDKQTNDRTVHHT